MKLRMSSSDTHKSPQIDLWKSLRRLKKCIYCRNKKQTLDVMNKFLQSRQTVDNYYINCPQLAFINLHVIAPLQYNSQKIEADKPSPIKWKYHNRGNVNQELKTVTFYYRYYDQHPLIIAGKVFELVSSYKVKRKMIEYQKIRTLYSPQKSTNVSSKLKSNPRKSKQFLNFIQQTRHDLTSSSVLIAQNLGFTSRKTVQQIDNEYCFGDKIKARNTKTRCNAFKTCDEIDQKIMKKSCVLGKKKQHKSCGNMHSESKSKSKKGAKVGNDKKSEHQKKRKIQLYISILKQKIEKEKTILRQLSVGQRKTNYNNRKYETEVKVQNNTFSVIRDQPNLSTKKAIKKKMNRTKKKCKI